MHQSALKRAESEMYFERGWKLQEGARSIVGCTRQARQAALQMEAEDEASFQTPIAARSE